VRDGAGVQATSRQQVKGAGLEAENPHSPEERSTSAMLDRLIDDSPLSNLHPQLLTLKSGYEFLSTLDHNLRLTIGRTTRVPNANHAVLTTIASRMNLDSPCNLLETLTLHRLAIREAFDEIFK